MEANQVLMGLLAGSEYLGKTDKFKANGWLGVICIAIAAIKDKLSKEKK